MRDGDFISNSCTYPTTLQARIDSDGQSLGRKSLPDCFPEVLSESYYVGLLDNEYLEGLHRIAYKFSKQRARPHRPAVRNFSEWLWRVGPDPGEGTAVCEKKRKENRLISLANKSENPTPPHTLTRTPGYL